MLNIRITAVTFLFALVCLLSSAGTFVSADSQYDNRPIIVMREDDGRGTWRTPFVGLNGMSGLDYGKLKHIPITWGIVTGFTTEDNFNSVYLTWSELRGYLNYSGGEIASHSHLHATRSTAQEYISELTTSRSIIEHSIPGYTCTTFFQPGTWGASPDSNDTIHANMDTMPELDNSIGQAIQSTFVQSMANLGNGWSIGNLYYKYGLGCPYSIDFGPSSTIPGMIATLDIVANTPGLVFVVGCHGVQETGATASYHVPADMLKAFMDKIAQLRDSGKVRLMSLNEAYHTTLSDNLNHLPDPAFEWSNPPLNYAGPWFLSGGASIASSGGIDNSRCGIVAANGANLMCGTMALQPGRYVLSWYQKVQPGYSASKPLQVALAQWYPSRSTAPFLAVSHASYCNSSTDAWEHKTALVLIKDDCTCANLQFISVNGAGYGVDNVSLTKALLDESVSPTRFSLSPSPLQATLSWQTPSDPSVTSLKICYGNRTHPLSPSEGTCLATVQAVLGTTQNVSIPMDWTTQDKMYFSVFAIRTDGSFAPPCITAVSVDKTTPSNPNVNVQVQVNLVVNARWFESTPAPQVFQYQYAVGTTPGADDVIPWTFTTETTKTLAGLPVKTRLYLSTRVQSAFGYWSSTSSTPLNLTVGIASLLAWPDNSTVSISGVISAIFSDCCYLEQSDRARGVKLTGNIAGLNTGDEVTVIGTLETSHGERAIHL